MKSIIFLFVSSCLISFGMVYADESSEYQQLKETYNEQRFDLEEEFEDKFRESSSLFQEQKQLINEKIKSDPTLTSEKINQMFKNAFNEFEERQEDIREEYSSRVDDLNSMFKVKFEQSVGKMPEWVEKVMELWQNGRISDAEFVNFLSFVINKDIIKLDQWIFSKYNN